MHILIGFPPNALDKEPVGVWYLNHKIYTKYKVFVLRYIFYRVPPPPHLHASPMVVLPVGMTDIGGVG